MKIDLDINEIIKNLFSEASFQEILADKIINQIENITYDYEGEIRRKITEHIENETKKIVEDYTQNYYTSNLKNLVENEIKSLTRNEIIELLRNK